MSDNQPITTSELIPRLNAAVIRAMNSHGMGKASQNVVLAALADETDNYLSEKVKEIQDANSPS